MMGTTDQPAIPSLITIPDGPMELVLWNGGREVARKPVPAEEKRPSIAATEHSDTLSMIVDGQEIYCWNIALSAAETVTVEAGVLSDTGNPPLTVTVPCTRPERTDEQITKDYREMQRPMSEAFDQLTDNYDCDGYGTDSAQDSSSFGNGVGTWLVHTERLLHRMQVPGFEKGSYWYDEHKDRMMKKRAIEEELAAAIEDARSHPAEHGHPMYDSLTRLIQAASPFSWRHCDDT